MKSYIYNLYRFWDANACNVLNYLNILKNMVDRSFDSDVDMYLFIRTYLCK